LQRSINSDRLMPGPASAAAAAAQLLSPTQPNLASSLHHRADPPKPSQQYGTRADVLGGLGGSHTALAGGITGCASVAGGHTEGIIGRGNRSCRSSSAVAGSVQVGCAGKVAFITDNM
jgi:hypothetical protein